MSEQTYRGTHRHRAPVGWHPPRLQSQAMEPDIQPEPTAPFTPTFTDGLAVVTDDVTDEARSAPPPAPLPAEVTPIVAQHEYHYLKRWMFVLVVVAVWIVAAPAGLALYHWWYISVDKASAVFAVLLYLMLCTVCGLLTAMVSNKPLISALAIAFMSAPFASMAAAAVWYGMNFCEHASRCLVGLVPY